MRQSEEGRNQLGGPPAYESYLTDGTTVMSWLNTRDHKRIGVMFLASVIFFLFIVLCKVRSSAALAMLYSCCVTLPWALSDSS